MNTENSIHSNLHLGQDPQLDAWLLHFMTENRLEHAVNPNENASPEQIKFMVDLEPNQIYIPCSEDMLNNIYEKNIIILRTAYKQIWRRFILLVHHCMPDRYIRKKVYTLARLKYRALFNNPILIPSRLLKRLTTIFLGISGLDDPYREQKIKFNAKIFKLISNAKFKTWLQGIPKNYSLGTSSSEIRKKLNLLELYRLMSVASYSNITQDVLNKKIYQISDLDKISIPPKKISSTLEKLFFINKTTAKRILYIPNDDACIILDLAIIRALIHQGHQVILSLKEGFYYRATTIWDKNYDPILEDALKDCAIIDSNQISKNTLLKKLHENKLIVISDGSYERINLYRNNVTFARAWKEADLIISHGEYLRFSNKKYKFTRNIFCFYADSQKELVCEFIPRSTRVIKITESQIKKTAEDIITKMKKYHTEGKKIMFYSAIVGSIPGQTNTAINLLNVFIKDLRNKQPHLYIINPAEHFIEGMDGDDLMYMWEIVQRSGYIDIWRFQTTADIEETFKLKNEPIPAIWNGKDSTFSTGCTKEMSIALDVQKTYPELQILGPSASLFFRRREYGVGKYFDETIG